MDIANTTQKPPNAPHATASDRRLSSDFDTFLQMLTVQIKNQDPLEPMDSSDFAVQLATFSGVEQQVLTNDLLTALSAQMFTSDMAAMSAWVGREARAPAAAWFDGTAITIAPNPALIADQVEVVVRNVAGQEVQRIQLPVSAEPYQWTGTGEGGLPFPAGLYAFEVVSSAQGNIILSEQADTYAQVQEVRSEGGEILLILRGGVAVPATLVSALREPGS